MENIVSNFILFPLNFIFFQAILLELCNSVVAELLGATYPNSLPLNWMIMNTLITIIIPMELIVGIKVYSVIIIANNPSLCFCAFSIIYCSCSILYIHCCLSCLYYCRSSRIFIVPTSSAYHLCPQSLSLTIYIFMLTN